MINNIKANIVLSFSTTEIINRNSFLSPGVIQSKKILFYFIKSGAIGGAMGFSAAYPVGLLHNLRKMIPLSKKTIKLLSLISFFTILCMLKLIESHLNMPLPINTTKTKKLRTINQKIGII